MLLLCLLLLVILSVTVSAGDDGRKQWINFISGGLAGTLSSAVVQPLEVVKTQLQSSLSRRMLNSLQKKADPISICKEIYRLDGIKGFYRGIKPMIVGIIPTRAIYFWSYNSAKNMFNQTLNMPISSPLTHLSSAFAAGIASNTITNPLWLVKTRYQLLADTSVGQKVYSSYGDIIRSIYREEGLGGFFKGLSGSYVGCFEGGIQWMVYEKLKTILAKNSKPVVSSSIISSPSTKKNKSKTIITTVVEEKKLSAWEYTVAASTAKMIAIIATYPHEVVRTRLREQAINGAFKYTGFLNSLNIIAKEEGIRGLYGGMGLHLLRSVPNAAVMFVTFELVSNFLDKQTVPIINSKK